MTRTSRPSLWFGPLRHRSPSGLSLWLCLLFTFCLVSISSIWARADDGAVSRRSAAESQFSRAESMRDALEAKPESARTLGDYTQLVSAYRRVYLITPRAAEVPQAIKQVGDLYRVMGDAFDRKYFDSAIQVYQFLLHDYPTSRLREDALLSVAQIQADKLSDSAAAEKTFESFLQEFPRSAHRDDVRKALAELKHTAQAGPVRDAVPAAPPSQTANIQGPSTLSPSRTVQQVSQLAAPQGSQTGHVRIWNADSYTRIVIDLGAPAKYQAARISNPDRIYFDIDNANLSPDFLRQAVDVPDGGYIKAVRVAQNRAGMVRVVLETTRVKDYSVFELSNPDRLVVDVYGSSRLAPSTQAALSSPSVPTSQGHTKARDIEQASEKSPSDAPAKANGSRKHDGAAAIGATSGSVPDLLQATENIQAKPNATGASRESMTTLSGRPASQSLPSALDPDASGGELSASRRTAESSGPASMPERMHSGEHSLTRALGLKVGRIVIDAGHGGRDTGTIGPTGLMEKDIALDISMRLGRLIEERLAAADVTYTRQSDTYVPLERRTAIANEAKADLFISIHANSSDDRKITGIETYYLNFNASPAAMEVAARENAVAQSSVHDLQDLVAKIARNEKAEESRDFALDVQDGLQQSMQHNSHSERDRGVRKAPFVVLIGANMPSVLAEISFLSNPSDELWLKKPENRGRVAEGLFRGIESYLHSVNSLTKNIAPASIDSRQQ